ncbi:MAG: efflux RND transporter periplasmic adaptor subunit [Bryobacteraceae bacterium]
MRLPRMAATATLALFLQACSNSSATVSSTPPPGNNAVTPPAVAVASVGHELLSRDVVLPGEFRAYQEADLHAKIAGFLKEINVDVGSRVQPGQTIAILEIPELEAEIAQSAADRNRVEADLLRAKAQLERAESQLELTRTVTSRLQGVEKNEPGLIARQEIDEAAAREKNAAADVAAARAAITAVEHQIEAAKASERKTRAMAGYSTITAPFAGIVTKRYADPGALIQAGTASHTQTTPLVHLAELSRLRFVAIVPEAIVPMIRTGMTAEIHADSSNRTLTGRVARLTGNVQLETRTMEVEIDVPNPRQDLLPGMFAEAKFTVSKSERVPVVPVQAVSVSGGNRWVYVVNGSNVLEQRAIRTGMESAAALEVLDGLAPDDRIVVGDRGLLKAGLRVDPRSAGASH